MTACTNHGGKARRVVTAALVGVLSVGTVPMVALAEGVSDGIQVMALDESAIKGGEVSYKNGESGATFTYNGRRQGLTADVLTPKGGSDPQKIQAHPGGYPEAGYYYFYVQLDGTVNFTASGVQYTDANGNKQTVKGTYLASTMPSEVGKYAVVTGYWSGGTSGSWTYVSTAATFSIAPKALTDAVIFEGNDTEDHDFSWDGVTNSNAVSSFVSNVGVSVDGYILTPGTDYELTILENGKEVTTHVMPGKQYVAHIVGRGNYNEQIKDITFTYDKFDLSEANVIGVTTTTKNATSVANMVATVNGNPASSLNLGDFALEFVSGPQGAYDGDAFGTYTYRLVAAAGSANVEGSKEFTFTKAGIVPTVTYAGNSWDSTDYVYEIGGTNPAFDITKIAANNGSDTIPAEQVKVTVTKADGSSATAEDLKSTPGSYIVDVNINYTSTAGDLIANHVSRKVIVRYGVTEQTDVFFTFNGENVESGTSAEYTGEDFTSKMGFEVYSGDKKLSEGTDYELVFTTTDDEGKTVEVDSIVDAGAYKVTVKGITFSGAFTYSFTVDRAMLTPVLNGTVTDRTGTDGTFLPYTGSAQDVSFTFQNKSGAVIELSADAYDVYVSKKGEAKESEVKDYDTWYTAHFDDYASKNFQLPETVDFKVKIADSFADVKTGSWYVAPVYQAKENGYVNGLKGTKLFNPEADITRADAVCIIYNMAGGKKVEKMKPAEKAAWTSKVTFTDVNTDEYYGVAIGWAESLDIANGFGGEFRPNDTITREEFAALLSNYAKSTDAYVAVDADAVLGSATDFSAWAKDVVAWAKANGVMGNGGYIDGTGNITRAEVAAMAVNYQPAPIA